MKKLLSVALALIIIIMTLTEGFSAFAKSTAEMSDLETFASRLSEIVRENDSDIGLDSDDDIIDKTIISVDRFLKSSSSSENNIYNGLSHTAFETKRLIVKSEKQIDLCNAIDCVSGYNDLYILQYDSQLSARNAYKYYLQCEYVDYVEPDIVMYSQELRGENENLVPEIGEITAESSEWLSIKLGFTEIKDKLSEMIKNDYVMVAIVDSGVDTDHTYLEGRLVESDVNLSSSGIDNSCEDDYGHGTHVAGIVSGNTLDNVKIKPYKVLNKNGNGSLSTVATAVDMAVADGADIVNLSLTGEGESKRLTEAIDNAVAKDVNVVCAAGNKNADLDEIYYSPACIESAITVSATDRDDKLAKFSNYDGTIDIAATGTEIQSSYLDNKYVSMSGTSMAAPQVCAGLAIIYSIFENESALEAEAMLKDYTILMDENPGENHYGAGLLFLKYILGEKPKTSTPVFSIDSCSFKNSFQVQITCAEPNAKIYYLLYNSENILDSDWVNAKKYSGPVTVNKTSKLAAVAFADGMKMSDIKIASYEREIDSEDDYYEINVLGYLTGYYGSDFDVVVPERIGSKTVKGVASNAFANNDSIRSIVLPDTAAKINDKAFMGCTQLRSVSGNGVTTLGASSFENSSVERVSFPNLENVGRKAFFNCINLSEFDFSSVKKIDNYAFQMTASLKELTSDSVAEVGVSSFESSGLNKVSLISAEDVNISAFNDCVNLKDVYIPSITTVSVGTFNGCTSLKNVDLSEVTIIEDNAFRNTGIEQFINEKITEIGLYAFADNPNIKTVSLPNVTTAGSYAFQNCNALELVLLNSLTELNNNTFANCYKLVVIDLPSVTTVNIYAFRYSQIQYVRFAKVNEIKSLPDTLKGLVVSGTLSSVTGAPSTDYTVYGYEGTFAQDWAEKNSKTFKPLPAVMYESANQIEMNDKYVMVYAMGFDCKYQWYRNTIESNVGGTIIDGATEMYYELPSEDDCAAYYCAITSSDGVNTNTIFTEPIINAPEKRAPDLSRYNELVEIAASLDRTQFDSSDLEDLDNLLNIDISGFTYAQQSEIDAIINQLSNELEYLTAPLIMGDLNGDRVVSAIDVRYALQHAAKLIVLSPKKVLIGDMNSDGDITAIDVRIILQKAAE